MDKRGFHRPSKTEDICVQQEKGKVKINNVHERRFGVSRVVDFTGFRIFRFGDFRLSDFLAMNIEQCLKQKNPGVGHTTTKNLTSKTCDFSVFQNTDGGIWIISRGGSGPARPEGSARPEPLFTGFLRLEARNS